jgi:hypothetical protein
MLGQFATVVRTHVTGHAALELPMGVRLGKAGTQAPGVLTHFRASWNANQGAFLFGPGAAGQTSTNPADGFGAFHYETGEFVHAMLGPLARKLDQFNPLTPDIMRALTTELPIIGKTPLEILEGSGVLPEEVLFLFDTGLVVATIDDLGPAGPSTLARISRTPRRPSTPALAAPREATASCSGTSSTR